LTLGLVGLGGCINDDVHLYEVTLQGSVAVAEGAPSDGRIIVELRHESSGEGTLAYPLRPISKFEVDGVGDFEEIVLVPEDEGTGLVVYAWLDADGDGTLCAPGGAQELAGLTVVDDYPAHSLEVALVLAQPCAGAEILYP